MRHLIRASLCLLVLLILTPASAQKQERKASKPPEPEFNEGVLTQPLERVNRGQAKVHYLEEVIDAEVDLPNVFEFDLSENQLEALRDLYRAVESDNPEARTRKF